MKILMSCIVLIGVFYKISAQLPIPTGKGSNELLYESDYKDWYIANYTAAGIDEAIIKSFPQIDDTQLKITVVLGTWCSDSRILVPHFFKILDYWHVKPEIEVYYVDRTIHSSGKGFRRLNVQHVPTFIFYNNRKHEIGRIIEQPATTLEKDMLHILLSFFAE